VLAADGLLADVNRDLDEEMRLLDVTVQKE